MLCKRLRWINAKEKVDETIRQNASEFTARNKLQNIVMADFASRQQFGSPLKLRCETFRQNGGLKKNPGSSVSVKTWQIRALATAFHHSVANHMALY